MAYVRELTLIIVVMLVAALLLREVAPEWSSIARILVAVLLALVVVRAAEAAGVLQRGD